MQTVEEVRAALRNATAVTSLVSLIRLGIEDGRRMLAERPDVRPDYSVWYKSPTLEDGMCTACLAGGVMLGTLAGLSRRPLRRCDLVNSHVLDLLYKREQLRALCALDRVRQGNIEGAYRALGLWYDPKGKRDPKIEAFRDKVRAVCEARRKRHPENLQAPAVQDFVSRDGFDIHLTSLAELADELEGVEA